MSPELPLSNSGQIPTERLPSDAIAEPKPISHKWLWQAGQYLLIAALASASYLLITHFFLESVQVVGVSMVPTLQNSQRFLLNRWVYHVRAPRRGDIVVLRDPMDNGFSVKRIVGLSGEAVTVRSGQVFVNGRRIDESYLSPGTATYPSPMHNEEEFQCGKNDFFVLGDNRNYSIDSRAYGPVPRKNILGLLIR